MNFTREKFLDAFMPLLLALHESKALDIAELPHYYEDVVQRRRNNGESEAALVFQASMIPMLQKLADRQKAQDRKIPPT